jgi:hypothetical protein
MYFWFNYVLKNNKHLVFKNFILFYYFISNSSDLISKNISKYKINTYGWQLFDDQRASRKTQLVVVCLSWMSRMNRVHHPCNILKKEFQAPCFWALSTEHALKTMSYCLPIYKNTYKPSILNDSIINWMS